MNNKDKIGPFGKIYNQYKMSKIEKIDGYLFIGSINKRIAKDANIKSAKIFISKNNLKHITKNHDKELLQLGITSLDFVKYIVQNFNQINIPSNGKSGIWLVVYKTDISKIAVLDINYSIENEFWEVITARPMRNTQLKRENNILWKKKERTLLQY